VREVDLAEASRLLVAAWRIEDGVLHVTPSGADEPLLLRCACRRCHWIVETRTTGGTAVLHIRCHGCGRSADLRLAGGPAAG